VQNCRQLRRIEYNWKEFYKVFKIFFTSLLFFRFDTASVSGPLIFADQFIEISSATDTGLIYGLGEHRTRLLHNASAMWQQYSMWSRDNPPTVCTFVVNLLVFFWIILMSVSVVITFATTTLYYNYYRQLQLPLSITAAAHCYKYYTLSVLQYFTMHQNK